MDTMDNNVKKTKANLEQEDNEIVMQTNKKELEEASVSVNISLKLNLYLLLFI